MYLERVVINIFSIKMNNYKFLFLPAGRDTPTTRRPSIFCMGTETGEETTRTIRRAGSIPTMMQYPCQRHTIEMKVNFAIGKRCEDSPNT